MNNFFSNFKSRRRKIEEIIVELNKTQQIDLMLDEMILKKKRATIDHDEDWFKFKKHQREIQRCIQEKVAECIEKCGVD
jgi:hypothetical protein